MPTIIDITGQRFGRLVALNRAPSRCRSTGSTRTMWRCRCDCGRETVVATCGLRTESRPTRSCGCTKVERLWRHGGVGTRLHRIWCAMKERTGNPKHRAWQWYGARGIAICAEWLDFAAFRDWALSHGYADHLTIERRDNDKGYEPGNCRWATMKEQRQNQRRRKSHG